MRICALHMVSLLFRFSRAFTPNPPRHHGGSISTCPYGDPIPKPLRYDPIHYDCLVFPPHLCIANQGGVDSAHPLCVGSKKIHKFTLVSGKWCILAHHSLIELIRDSHFHEHARPARHLVCRAVVIVFTFYLFGVGTKKILKPHYYQNTHFTLFPYIHHPPIHFASQKAPEPFFRFRSGNEPPLFCHGFFGCYMELLLGPVEDSNSGVQYYTPRRHMYRAVVLISSPPGPHLFH